MTEATQTNVPTTSPPAVAIDYTGRVIGDFHLLRRLGQGGMGQVYLAEQRSLKRNVALKILRGDLAANSTALQRFKQEGEAVAQATHPNIVQVYAFGEADGLTYMALEYVEGRNLKEFLARKGPPELLLAISFMRQVAAALQRASELGIIHRDIKPENIMLTRKGEVKVADFGLSRVLVGDQQPVNLTQSGVTMGTPLYMAPEQVEGHPVDPRTDIYSFGVTCYHMMAGEPPFTGTNAFEVALAHVRTEPEPLTEVRPDLPAEFCAIVHKMMAKNPDDRYQSGRELLKDLGKVRESLGGVTAMLKTDELGVDLPELDEPAEAALFPSSGAQTLRGARPRPSPRRRWSVWKVMFAVCAVLLALGVGVATAWMRLGGVSRPPVVETGGTKQTNAPELDVILNAQNREKVLLPVVEQYLNPQSAGKNLQTGFGLCMDLGFCYLEQDKLDEAEQFYTRLENIKQIESYQILGSLGRAIVLALRNKSKESNDLFTAAFARARFPDPAAKGVSKTPEQPYSKMLQNPQMRWWLAEAVRYNQKGGVPRIDVPQLLRNTTRLPSGKQK